MNIISENYIVDQFIGKYRLQHSKIFYTQLHLGTNKKYYYNFQNLGLIENLNPTKKYSIHPLYVKRINAANQCFFKVLKEQYLNTKDLETLQFHIHLPIYNYQLCKYEYYKRTTFVNFNEENFYSNLLIEIYEYENELINLKPLNVNIIMNKKANLQLRSSFIKKFEALIKPCLPVELNILRVLFKLSLQIPQIVEYAQNDIKKLLGTKFNVKLRTIEKHFDNIRKKTKLWFGEEIKQRKMIAISKFYFEEGLFEVSFENAYKNFN